MYEYHEIEYLMYEYHEIEYLILIVSDTSDTRTIQHVTCIRYEIEYLILIHQILAQYNIEYLILDLEYLILDTYCI
jgi:hypothetical protein